MNSKALLLLHTHLINKMSAIVKYVKHLSFTLHCNTLKYILTFPLKKGVASARRLDSRAAASRPASRAYPPTSCLLHPPASTWGLPMPVGIASVFPRLTLRRGSKKARREM